LAKRTSGFFNKAIVEVRYVRSQWLAFHDFANAQRFRAEHLCVFCANDNDIISILDEPAKLSPDTI